MFSGRGLNREKEEEGQGTWECRFCRGGFKQGRQLAPGGGGGLEKLFSLRSRYDKSNKGRRE